MQILTSDGILKQYQKFYFSVAFHKINLYACCSAFTWCHDKFFDVYMLILHKIKCRLWISCLFSLKIFLANLLTDLLINARVLSKEGIPASWILIDLQPILLDSQQLLFIPGSFCSSRCVPGFVVNQANFHDFFFRCASEIHIPRNLSCPVSPIGSPLVRSRSPQHPSGRMSPSPISSPRNMSGASTPLTGGNGAIPHQHLKQSSYLQEGFGSLPKPSVGSYSNCPSYHDTNPDIFQGIQPGSHIFSEQFGKPAWELYDGQAILADRVSRQLLSDHITPSLDLSPSALLTNRRQLDLSNCLKFHGPVYERKLTRWSLFFDILKRIDIGETKQCCHKDQQHTEPCRKV